MKQALSSFDSALARVEHMGGIVLALDRLTTPIVDSSDILRSQIVLAVSALDYFVHELAVLGMLEVFDGIRAPTDAYEKFQIPVKYFAGPGTGRFLNRSSLEAAIRERHSFLSFQRPDKIADAVRLFSPIRLWDDVSKGLNETPEDLKRNLNLIVDRRNKIAHESDADPSYPGARWPITATDVGNVTTRLSSLGHAIFRAL